ncbi:MAG TPA: hypothetical protein VFA09_04105 [Ktedonobacteraceae bacterium]|nr:hypothetical protein [Ktedonobacteraceae bacterium]
MSGFTTRQLGKTGLQASPLGIGGGWGIESSDLLYAFEQGINYFFFSSDLHHFSYRKSAAALRTLCGMGSSVRDRVILATVSYVNDPDKIPAILMDQFGELGVDYIDIFHWGWITDNSDCDSLIEAANQLKAGGSIARAYRRNQAAMLMAQAHKVNEELLSRGLVRFVGCSFHSRQAAHRSMAKLDVLMLRYNLSHTGVEQDIFPHLTGDKARDPGIVAFNVAHEANNFFHIPPRGYPADHYVPTIPDCYRFALSNPYVDVVLTGVRNRAEVDQALAAMQKGPLSEEECAYLRAYGRIHAGKAPLPGPRQPVAAGR